jgi:hypothetical protein
VLALVRVVVLVVAGDASKSRCPWIKPLEKEGERLFPPLLFFAVQSDRQYVTQIRITNRKEHEMMKKMRLFLMAMVGLSFLLVPWMGYGQDAVIKDTAVFDKAYIPPLFLTSQGKVEESRLAMEFLKEDWAVFKEKYYSAQPNDVQWKKDMDKAEELIMAADKTVASGKDLRNAHGNLEEAGGIL